MRLRTLPAVLLILSVTQTCFSQDSSGTSNQSQHLITFSSGITTHAVRDEMLSPLIYRGTQMPLSLSYRYRGQENRHTILLSYDNSELTSSITRRIGGVPLSHYITDLHLTFEYSFAVRVVEMECLATSFFFGGRFSSFLNLRDHYFLRDNNHMSAEQVTSLGVYFLTETSLPRTSRNVLNLELGVPCISYALLNSRFNANVSEEFDVIDLEGDILWQLFKKGNIVSFNRFFGFQADISYSIVFSRYVGCDLRYRLTYYAFAQYEDLLHARAVNNQFLLGLTVIL